MTASRGTKLPRDVDLARARGTDIAREVELPRDAGGVKAAPLDLLCARGTSHPREIGAARAAAGVASARGMNGPREIGMASAHDTSVRRKIATGSARGMNVRQEATPPSARGMSVPREVGSFCRTRGRTRAHFPNRPRRLCTSDESGWGSGERPRSPTILTGGRREALADRRRENHEQTDAVRIEDSRG